MKLNQLAAATEVPVSSIKFYLREGLLPPGEKLNATTARYGDHHKDRLELIKVLRHAVGLSLEQVRPVIAAVDDVERVNAVELMGAVQTAVLNSLDARGSSTGDDAVPAAPSSTDDVADGAAGQQERAKGESAQVTAREVVTAMGWPEGTGESMAALDRELGRMAGWGMAPCLDTAMLYARAASMVAAHQIRATRRQAEQHGSTARDDGSVNRDRMAGYVALGVYSDSQLLLRLVAVAQGAHAQLDAPHNEREQKP